MVAIGVIGFTVLILIYFVLKNQSLQKEMNQYKHSLKASDGQTRSTLNNLNFLAKELQKVYMRRLSSAKKHGLIQEDDFTMSATIIENFAYVVMRCSEHNETVEEAVIKSLDRSTIEIQEVNHFIAAQPQEIKLPWCKNQLGGYVLACQHISRGQAPKKPQPQVEDNSAN